MQDNKEEIQKKIEILKKQKARLELEIKYLEIDLKLVDNLKKSSIEKNKEVNFLDNHLEITDYPILNNLTHSDLYCLGKDDEEYFINLVEVKTKEENETV